MRFFPFGTWFRFDKAVCCQTDTPRFGHAVQQRVTLDQNPCYGVFLQTDGCKSIVTRVIAVSPRRECPASYAAGALDFHHALFRSAALGSVQNSYTDREPIKSMSLTE